MSGNIKNKICVYAICKNESQFVENWLQSMSEADYIVVLDTGSADNTYELLKNDPRVYRAEQKIIAPWRFDVARNESMKLIPEEANILVCTDLDELLDPGWADVLRAKWIEGTHRRGTYKYAWSHNEVGDPSVVFQYDKVHSRGWKWAFPVHEALVHEDSATNVTYYFHETLDIFDEMFLHHYPDHTKSRGSYLPLLELRKQEYPEDYYGRIYLAHEYYYRGLYQQSIDELQDILDNYANKYNQLEQASCYLFMGDSYRALESYTEAIIAYWHAIQKDNTYREPYINMAEVLNQLGYYHQAIGIIQDCFDKTYRHYNWLERGGSWQHEPHDALSVSYYWTGDYQASYEQVQIALKYCPSDPRILKNLEYITDKLNEMQA